MVSKDQQSLQKRAQKAIIEYAFLRWESAGVISLTTILTVLSLLFKNVGMIPGWTWMLWLPIGLISEALIVYTSVTNPETARRVIAKMVREKFHPERLHNKALQQKVDKACDYHSRIEAAILQGRHGLLKEHLSETARQIGAWLKNMHILAQRLDHYQEEKTVLERDQKQVHKRLQQLQRQLRTESDSQIKQQIRLTIESLRHQLTTIETLENTMQQAELQLEHTLSALGTMYSQSVLIEAKDMNSDQARRLRQEITEEMNGLGHILSAMDDVYAAENHESNT